VQIPLKRYWHLLRTYLQPRWPKVLLLGLLLAVSIALQLYNPRVLQGFIDAALAGAPVGRLTWLAVTFVGLALGNQLLSVLATYLSQDVGWRATNELRADLTLHALRLDLAYHKARTPGEMIERIDGDVSLLAGFFSQFIVLVLTNAVLLAGVLVVLFRVDWRAGLALTAFAAVNLGVLLRTRNVATPGWQEARRCSAEFFGFLGERLAGLEDLRANGAEGYTLQGFVQHMRQRLQAELKGGRGMATMLIVSFGLIAVGMATAFAVSAYLVTAGAISVGTAYLVFAYTEQLRRPVEQIVSQLQDLARAGAAISRVQELLAARPTVGDGDGTTALPTGALSVEVTGLSFGYTPGKPVLQDVSFALKPGQVLGLLGRTGSGKSTLARLLARLHDPEQGCVQLGGIDLRDLRQKELRRRVGVVTQDVQLFAATLRQNLTFFDATIPDERIWEALVALDLEIWVRSLPLGLETPLASGGGLSAGEAQLLAFARVFLKDPGLVILDEASSRLDPATEQRLEQAIDRLLQNRTAIVIAHRLTTLQRADTILVLEDGAALEYGAREALASDPSSRFAYLLQRGFGEVSA
jgi:ATP-binding cassette subfamily B protein